MPFRFLYCGVFEKLLLSTWPSYSLEHMNIFFMYYVFCIGRFGRSVGKRSIFRRGPSSAVFDEMDLNGKGNIFTHLSIACVDNKALASSY